MPVEVNSHIFLDLETLAFLATNLQPLRLRCYHLGVEFRAYTSPDHDWADRATHLSKNHVLCVPRGLETQATHLQVLVT